MTEVRWKTDADGEVGKSECAKYDYNAATPWSTNGDDVGADLAVNAALRMSLGDKNQVLLYTDFTQGDSDGARILVEFSQAGADWYQMTKQTVSGNVTLYTGDELEVQEDTLLRIAFPVADSLMRLSVKALTSATNAELGVLALLGAI